MKNVLIIFPIILIVSILTINSVRAQTSAVPLSSLDKSYPWTADQLIEPADLAAIINSPKANAEVIFNIGAVDDIKSAKHIGPVSNTGNLEEFKKEVGSLSKNTVVIIYCGCCPFTKCPNIRPAFLELKKMGFTQIKVLNLPVNLQTNWISRGYPLAGK